MSDFSTAADILADILARLPDNARRRLRLVCRLWRDVIDKRAAVDMRSRSKILAVTTQGTTHVVDVLSPGSHTDMWQSERLVPAYGRPMAMSVVGTCNGLVCLCDDQQPGGAITLANPATREELRLPPLPGPSAAVRMYQASNRTWHQTYCFARSRTTTGRYKVVHVPCYFDPFWEPGVVHVFTLGVASWRGVQLGSRELTSCSLGGSSLVDVGGTVYWTTEDTGKVVAFDLKDERITRAELLPVPAVRPARCRLTELHARLGVAVNNDVDDTLTVWVLEGEGWSSRYVLEARWLWRQQLVFPHFAFGGDYVLSGQGSVLYRHKTSAAAKSQGGVGVVHVKSKDRGQKLTSLPQPVYRIFAYIETKEPLSA